MVLGVTRTFGLGPHQHLRPAARNEEHWELWNALHRAVMEFDPTFKFSAMQVNKTTGPVWPHVDRHNEGPSYIIGLGDYEGGEFWTEGRSYNIRNRFLRYNGNLIHYPRPHTGTRYSVVFYSPIACIANCNNRASASLDANNRSNSS